MSLSVVLSWAVDLISAGSSDGSTSRLRTTGPASSIVLRMETQQTTSHSAIRPLRLVLAVMAMVVGVMAFSAPAAQAQGGEPMFFPSACIESTHVLDDPAAQGEGVGATFINSVTGWEYFINSGGPTCSINCMNGWDFNCDGKIGDFCPVEFNRDRVSGAAACLAALR